MEELSIKDAAELLVRRLEKPRSESLFYTVGKANIAFEINEYSIRALLYLRDFDDLGEPIDQTDMCYVWICTDENLPIEFKFTNTQLDLDILEALVNACNGQFKSLLNTTGKVHDKIFEKVSEEKFCRAVEGGDYQED